MTNDRYFQAISALSQFPDLVQELYRKTGLTQAEFNAWRAVKSKESTLKSLREAPKPSGLIKLNGIEGKYTWHPRTDDFGDYIVLEKDGKISRINKD